MSQTIGHPRELDLDGFERLIRSEIEVYWERDVYWLALQAVEELRELRAERAHAKAQRARAERDALLTVPPERIVVVARIIDESGPEAPDEQR